MIDSYTKYLKDREQKKDVIFVKNTHIIYDLPKKFTQY